MEDTMTTFIWLMMLVIAVGAGYYWFRVWYIQKDEEGGRIYACACVGAACAFADGLILQDWFPLGGTGLEIVEALIHGAEALLLAWILFFRRKDFSIKQKIIVLLALAFLLSLMGSNIKTIVLDYQAIWADTGEGAQMLHDLGETAANMAEDKLITEKFSGHDVEISGIASAYAVEQSHNTVEYADYTVALSYYLDDGDTEQFYGYEIRVTSPGTEQQALEVIQEGEQLGEELFGTVTEEE